ncbi:hypothetical protein HK101_011281 [Irineochytrium annulatum]|nr:hypothetical protein HK101_011281 [Irineochytrium annulatum]
MSAVAGGNRGEVDGSISKKAPTTSTADRIRSLLNSDSPAASESTEVHAPKRSRSRSATRKPVRPPAIGEPPRDLTLEAFAAEKVKWKGADAHRLAFEYFETRSAYLASREDWDPTIYTGLLEPMISRRPRKGWPGKIYEDINIVVTHAKEMGHPLEAKVMSALIKALAEDDLVVMKMLRFERGRRARLMDEMMATAAKGSPIGDGGAGAKGTKGPADTGRTESDWSTKHSQALSAPSDPLLATVNRNIADLEHQLNFLTRARRLFDESLARELSLDLPVHDALLTSLAHRGDVVGTIRHHDAHMTHNPDLLPGPKTYAALILAHAYAGAEHGDLPSARAWFDAYRGSELETDSVPYAAFVDVCVAHGDVAEAERVLSEVMAVDGLKFTSAALTSFAEALAIAGRHAEVLEWYGYARDGVEGFPRVTDGLKDVCFASAVVARDLEGAREFFPSDERRHVPLAMLSDLGLGLLRTGDVEGAGRCFEKIRQQVVGGPVPGRAEVVMGRADRAFLEELVKAREDKAALMKAARECFEPDDFAHVAAQAMGFGTFASVLAVARVLDGASMSQQAGRNLLDSFLQDKGSDGVEIDALGMEMLFRACFVAKRKGMLTANVKSVLDKIEAKGLTIPFEVLKLVLELFKKQGAEKAVAGWIKFMRKKGAITGPRIDGELITPAEHASQSKKIAEASVAMRLDEAIAAFDDVIGGGRYPTIPATCELISTLGKAGRWDEMERVTAAMLKAMEKGGVATDPSTDVWVSIKSAEMLGHVRGGDFKGAKEVMDRMIQDHGRAPSRMTLATFLDSACTAAKREVLPVEEAVELVTDAHKALQTFGKDFERTSAWLNDQALWVLSVAGKADDAYKMYQLMRKLKQTPTNASMTALLSAVCRTSPDPTAAMVILDDMVDTAAEQRATYASQHEPPNADPAARDRRPPSNLRAQTFNVVMRMQLDRFNDPKAAVRVWRLAASAGFSVRPDEETLELLARAHAGGGDISTMAQLLDDIESKRLHMSETVLEALVVGMVKVGGGEAVGRAVGVVAGILEKLKVVWANARDNTPNMRDYDAAGRVLLSTPNRATLEAVFVGCLSVGDFDSAWRFFNAITELKVGPPTTAATEVMMQALMARGDFSLASTLLQNMPSKADTANNPSLLPCYRTSKTFRLAIMEAFRRGLKEDAMALIKAMEADGLPAEEVLAVKREAKLVLIGDKADTSRTEQAAAA